MAISQQRIDRLLNVSCISPFGLTLRDLPWLELASEMARDLLENVGGRCSVDVGACSELLSAMAASKIMMFRCPVSSSARCRISPCSRSCSTTVDGSSASSASSASRTANVVVIGAGWWSQGWHLPHLHRNERARISAIVGEFSIGRLEFSFILASRNSDSSPHPKSNLNPKLVPLDSLAEKYGANIYSSVDELLKSQDGKEMDGAIICTPHSTHFDIAAQLIDEGKRRFDGSTLAGHRPMNVLIEKPITTNVGQARELQRLLLERSEAEKGASAGAIGGGIGCFQINHSANFRPQARMAREIVESGKLGEIQHVSASFASPLSWIFDDPAMTPWNEPDPKDSEMLGNGFAWGQQSHLISWIYHVVGKHLTPDRVFCGMTHSEETGADVSHSSTVLCKNGAVLSLSGTSLLPGNAHSDPPVGKRPRLCVPFLARRSNSSLLH